MVPGRFDARAEWLISMMNDARNGALPFRVRCVLIIVFECEMLNKIEARPFAQGEFLCNVLFNLLLHAVTTLFVCFLLYSQAASRHCQSLTEAPF